MRALLVAFALLASMPVVSPGQAPPPGPTPPRAPLGPSSGPRPLLFGFALDCTRCRLTPGEIDPAPVWRYAELPTVAAVRPGGAAALGGVHVGDTIVAVDGLSILSADGARRFSTVRPGDRVRLTVRRAGREVDAVVALRRAGDAPPPRAAQSEQPRYSGHVAGASVDVYGPAPVSVTVDSAGGLVMQIGSSTVRVAPAQGNVGAAAAAPTASGRNRRP